MVLIHFCNRQRTVKVRLEWLRRFAEIALPECALHSANGDFALRQFPEVDLAIVSDRVIARVHRQFMNIPGPTDVITFEHGEIVMSAETAIMNARRYGQSVDAELALYTVHGLLHLNGYEDASASDAKRMRKTQERVMKACFERISPP
jgi:probable rRNA maturation factor